MRRTALLAPACLAALVLAGCSSAPTEASIGERLEVGVRQAEVDATAAVTVTEVSSMSVAEAKDELQLPEAYDDGTVFLVRFDAALLKGEYPEDSIYGFGAENWAAAGKDDVDVVTINARPDVEVDGCAVFSTDDAMDFASGVEVSSCVLFASERADAAIESVVYGQKSISRRGSGNGWSWAVNG
ncbi:hypothetical protein [Agromyces sp. NBRC 114283]|uniref:hypothetical protein n=1 Tax=Agromyces sp. NBRC 114283 TaxID=2994521 RepID=UPI002556F91C|nr:hypothetical protein [Agromyces sp. NBRC 114283]